MSKILDLIREKGIDQKLQDSINKAAYLCNGDIPQEITDEAVKQILEFEILRNHDLERAFVDYMYELGMNSLVKELGIKCNPDAVTKHSECDCAKHSIAVMLIDLLCR